MRRPSKTVLEGIKVACRVALVNFEAASDGSGDVGIDDAKKIERALEWAKGESR